MNEVEKQNFINELTLLMGKYGAKFHEVWDEVSDGDDYAKWPYMSFQSVEIQIRSPLFTITLSSEEKLPETIFKSEE